MLYFEKRKQQHESFLFYCMYWLRAKKLLMSRDRVENFDRQSEIVTRVPGTISIERSNY